MIRDIKSLKDYEVFEDDHITCCKLLGLTDDQDHTFDLDLWWCGPDGPAAAKYWNCSVQAKADLIELVNNQLQRDAENDETTPHHQLCAVLGSEYTVRYDTDDDHPESVVTLEGDARDLNIEVIYHTSGDVILIQDNGDDHKHLGVYVWTSDPDAMERVGKIVKDMLS